MTHEDFNRVTVTSYLWTAVCCDASSTTSPQNGFSFAYIGKNTADSFVDILKVSELQARLTSLELKEDRYEAAKNCTKETARNEVAAPVNLRLANAANVIRRMEQSTIPPKKRKVFHEVLDLIQSGISASGYSLTSDKENMFNNQTLP